MRSTFILIAMVLTGCVSTHESKTPTHRSQKTDSNWIFANDTTYELESTVAAEQPGAAKHPRPTHMPNACGLACAQYWGGTPVYVQPVR